MNVTESLLKDIREMEESDCNWCGADCSFLSTAPGLCVPCGDAMQSMPITDVIAALAKAVEENRRLREACRAAANCDHTHTPDVLALLEEALENRT